MKKVNTNSPEPSYYQLMNIIQEQISSGELQPGDRLPTESELCSYHEISPMTVHRAITELKKSNLIIAKRGSGIFVKPIQFWEATFQLNLFKKILDESNNVYIKILELKILSADHQIANKLKIKEEEKVIFIRRIIFSQNKPFLLHEEYLLYNPEKPIIESEMEITSLKGLFEGGAHNLFKRISFSIFSTNLEKTEAESLLVPSNAAAFRIEHIFFNFNNIPISYGWFICPGDRMHFSTVTGIQDGDK